MKSQANSNTNKLTRCSKWLWKYNPFRMQEFRIASCVVAYGALGIFIICKVLEQQNENPLIDVFFLCFEIVSVILIMFGLIYANVHMIEHAIFDKIEAEKNKTTPVVPMPAFRASAVHKQTTMSRTDGRKTAVKENNMRTVYKSTYIETSDVRLAWVAFRTRLEVTGQTGPGTLYAKNRFVVDDERMLSPEEARSGGDFDVENNLIAKDKDAAAHRVVNNDGETVGWLFAGLVTN